MRVEALNIAVPKISAGIGTAPAARKPEVQTSGPWIQDLVRGPEDLLAAPHHTGDCKSPQQAKGQRLQEQDLPTTGGSRVPSIQDDSPDNGGSTCPGRGYRCNPFHIPHRSGF